MKIFHANAHSSSFENLTEEPTILVTPRDTTQKKNLTAANVGEECNFSQNAISDLENRQPSCSLSTG